jgi:hypothetical protein
MEIEPKYIDPKIWGPPYWFFLHTVALTYPHHPNDVTKKKYYEFIQNLPLFLPVEQISKEFEQLLEKFPVTPYLENRTSFIKWIHFIHNQINLKLEKPTISLHDFRVQYYNHYKSQNEKMVQFYKMKEKIIYSAIVLSVIGVIYYVYDK